MRAQRTRGGFVDNVFVVGGRAVRAQRMRGGVVGGGVGDSVVGVVGGHAERAQRTRGGVAGGGVAVEARCARSGRVMTADKKSFSVIYTQ